MCFFAACRRCGGVQFWRWTHFESLPSMEPFISTSVNRSWLDESCLRTSGSTYADECGGLSRFGGPFFSPDDIGTVSADEPAGLSPFDGIVVLNVGEPFVACVNPFRTTADLRYQLYHWNENLAPGVEPELKVIETSIYGVRSRGTLLLQTDLVDSLPLVDQSITRVIAGSSVSHGTSGSSCRVPSVTFSFAVGTWLESVKVDYTSAEELSTIAEELSTIAEELPDGEMRGGEILRVIIC